jgi:hypothetical protein
MSTGQGNDVADFATLRTTFDIFEKLPAETDYKKVAEDIIEKTFDVTDLDAGSTYNFKVVGRNSLGDGPDSDVASIAVT